MRVSVGSWIAVLVISGALSGCGESSKPSNAGAGRSGNDGGSAAAGSPGVDGQAGASGSAGVGGASGDGGVAGASGTGGGPQLTSSKLDLLLVVDNSRSMAHKQAVLLRSTTTLVSRLANPYCIDAQGSPVAAQPASADAPCPAGSSREMVPVRDMHVGVISSSLGGHGADTCSASGPTGDPTEDDRGELLTRGGAATYQNRGYLVWDPNQTANPPGENSASALSTNVAALVTGAGELGCGFESTLEAWYRFLVDPEPFASVVVQSGVAVHQGTNQTVLTQRAQFLRPDSAVLVVILSDENDCSVKDNSISWLMGQANFLMPRATAACSTTPNSACCRSCSLSEAAPPSGCAALDADTGCTPRSHDSRSDPLNVRCWDQKRRFGIDFLQPIERYVRGLTSPTVPDRSGAMVKNPLFADLSAGGALPRDPSLISVAGIIGVPWQDLAKNAADTTTLRYMTAAELSSNGRWPTILGDPAGGTPPLDPFMHESIDPRSGTNPVTGDAIQPPSAATPLANAINGHEHQTPLRNDLQYACIFPLLSPVDCASTSSPTSCECTTADAQANKVLCQAPNGTYGNLERYGMAYPGLRQLELLSQLGRSSVVTSICPRNVSDSTRDDYAYNPAVQAMIDRMKNVIK